MDRGILLPFTAISDNRKSLSEWAANMLEQQHKLINLAAAIQRRKDQLHIVEADPRRTTFNVGEYVLLEYQSSSLVKGRPPNKLLPNLKGPMRVLNRSGDKYKLESLIDGRDEEVHVSKLHPYHFDPTYTSLRDAALRDVLTLFDVEEVLDHRGDRTKRKELDFYVKFLGWNNDYNLWLPYSELRDNRALHTYLINNRMRSLIPSKFRENNQL